jgi:hypothetical protein
VKNGTNEGDPRLVLKKYESKVRAGRLPPKWLTELAKTILDIVYWRKLDITL